MTKATPLSELVDLQRYPLHDDQAIRAVIEQCRTQLKQTSLACLPGFLSAAVAQAMTREVLDAIPRAHRREHSFSAYSEVDLSDYPSDHVRWRKHLNRQFVVATDILDRGGLLLSLYRDDTLRRRIAAMLNEPELYQLEDPVIGCTATAMFEGDTHGWHFDLNDFVVSILLQAPEAGGTCDFAPDLRDDGAENYAAVEAGLDGRSAALRSVKVEPGTLLLF